MKRLCIISALFFVTICGATPRVRSRLEIARDLFAQRCAEYEDACRQTPDDYCAVELAKTRFEVMAKCVAQETFREREKAAAQSIIRWARQQLERKKLAQPAAKPAVLSMTFEECRANSASAFIAKKRKMPDAEYREQVAADYRALREREKRLHEAIARRIAQTP